MFFLSSRMITSLLKKKSYFLMRRMYVSRCRETLARGKVPVTGNDFDSWYEKYNDDESETVPTAIMSHRLSTERCLKSSKALPIYSCTSYINLSFFRGICHSSGPTKFLLFFWTQFEDHSILSYIFKMTLTNLTLCVLLIGTLSVSIVTCVPKYDAGGFVPSSIDYLEKSDNIHDQVAMPSHSQPQFRSEGNSSKTRKSGSDSNNDISDRGQEPRFGFTNLGSTGSGYGVSPYAPVKIDLGGLILGAVLGVGSILVIPKLLYVLSGSYGTYARSDEGGLGNTMTKLDDALARHGIDTTSCMQRAVCTYAQRAAETMREANDITDDEKISTFDRMVETLTTNQVFRTAMRGTAIQEAVEAGRGGQNCTRTYRQCGFSLETILSLISNLMSGITSSNESVPTVSAL